MQVDGHLPGKTYAALTIAAGVEVAVDVDAVLGEFRPSTFTSDHHFPQGGGRGGITRETAAQPDNGYGLHFVGRGSRHDRRGFFSSDLRERVLFATYLEARARSQLWERGRGNGGWMTQSSGPRER